MKTQILTFVFYLIAVSCSNEDKGFHAKLPPETQIGSNTFGVTIKGKVYVPRTPTGHPVGTSPKALIFWGTSDNSWNELEAKDYYDLSK